MGDTGKHYSIVIPALNEEEGLTRVLSKLEALAPQEIIVVDGGSTDGTRQVASKAGARVVLQPQRGYGQACSTGAKACRSEIVVFMDADGADDPQNIDHLIQPIIASTADLVLGSRLSQKKSTASTMPWHQRLGNKIAAHVINRLYNLAITDLSPMRAIKRSMLKSLDMQEMTYGWPTEMIVKAARRHWRIVEIPVLHHPRLGGSSKISGTIQGTVLAAWYIFSTIFRHRPKKLRPERG